MKDEETQIDESVDERSAGGVVIGDGGTIALVLDSGGARWLFPKGHVEEGETDEEAARREIEEEAGLTNLEYIDDLGTYKRHPINPDGSPFTSVMKEIHMFLFAAPPHAKLNPITVEEISDAQWFPFREVAEKIGSDKDKAWFASVGDRVQQAIQRD